MMLGQSEAVMLHRILPFYVQHLERHPESLLCKFFSCTALRLYRQTIYFVVRATVASTWRCARHGATPDALLSARAGDEERVQHQEHGA